MEKLESGLVLCQLAKYIEEKAIQSGTVPASRDMVSKKRFYFDDLIGVRAWQGVRCASKYLIRRNEFVNVMISS